MIRTGGTLLTSGPLQSDISVRKHHVPLWHPTALVHSIGQGAGTSIVSEANVSEAPQNIEK